MNAHETGSGSHLAVQAAARDGWPAGIGLACLLRSMSAPVGPLLATLLLVLAAARVTHAQELHASRSASVESTVMGTVYAFETGMPLAGALVSLEHRTMGGGIGGTYLANDEGHFLFRDVPPGVYALVVTSLGYRTLRDSVRVEPFSDHRLTLQLSPAPIDLEPVVVVVARRARSLFMEAFEARREREHGVFIDRREIEQRNPQRVSDLLAGVPGAQMLPLRRGGYGLYLRGCRPDVWVNGVRTVDSDSNSSGIDQFIGAAELEAVEVYTGTASVPIQFAPATCGAVVIWTRVADPTNAPTTKLWTRTLAALGLLGIGYLLGH